MVDIGLVDLSVFQLDSVREEPTKTAAPLNNSSDSNSKHEIISLDVLLLGAKLPQVFQMPCCFAPGKGFSELPSRPFKV